MQPLADGADGDLLGRRCTPSAASVTRILQSTYGFNNYDQTCPWNIANLIMPIH